MDECVAVAVAVAEAVAVAVAVPSLSAQLTLLWDHLGGSRAAWRRSPFRVSRALIYRACAQNQASGELPAGPAGPGRERHLSPSGRPTKREPFAHALGKK